MSQRAWHRVMQQVLAIASLHPEVKEKKREWQAIQKYFVTLPAKSR